MTQTRKPVALALGAAVATGTLLAGSMFSMQAMAQGYMQDATPKTTAAEGKCGEGKCGEGKCGGDTKMPKAPRDVATGQASGKRQHKPSVIRMDMDKDGRLSRTEFDAAHKGSQEKFGAHDLDGDGFITQAEMDAHHAAMAQGKIAKESHGMFHGKKAAAEGKCGEGKCGEGKCGSKP